MRASAFCIQNGTKGAAKGCSIASISYFLYYECKIGSWQRGRTMGTIENLTDAGLERRIERRPLHEEVIDQLRDRIVQGELAPGARLNERVLCEQLGISRTPLREAIKMLAAEGLVDLLPNRGAIVSRIDAARLAETLHVMGALEGLAGELACRHASADGIARIRALL